MSGSPSTRSSADVAAWPERRRRRLRRSRFRHGSGAGDRRAWIASYPVEQAGELLGALAIRKPASDPVSPADEKLIADLAGASGSGAPERPAHRGPQAAARRAEGAADAGWSRRRTRAVAGWSGTSTTGRSSSSSRSRSSSSSPTGSIERDTTKAHELLAQTPGRDARRARGSAGPGPWDLSAVARRQRSARGARGTGAQERFAGQRCERTASVGTRRPSRRPSTSRASRRCRTSRSTPRRPTSSSSWPNAASASGSR